MQTADLQEAFAMTSGISDFEFDFNFDFDIPDVYKTIIDEGPLPEFNIDAQTPDLDSLITPLDGSSADAFQTDTVAPLGSLTAPQSTTTEHEKSPTDECGLTFPKVRKLSASRWVPCAAPESQREPSKWLPIAAPSNLAPSFAIPALPQYVYPDPQTVGLAYHYPSPSRVMPGNNFSAMTPPGRQTASLPIPGFMHGGVVPTLMPPPTGRSRRMAPGNDMRIADLHQGKKRKRDTTPVANHGIDDESDSAIFSGRRPPKKLRRPRQYKQKEEQLEKCRERSERRQQLQGNNVQKKHQVAESPIADSSREESPEYILGASRQEYDGNGLLRRSSRQSKPRFPDLQF